MLEKTKTEKMIDKKVWWISNSKERNETRDKLLGEYALVIAKEKMEQLKIIKEEYKSKGFMCFHYGEYLSYIPQYYRRDPKSFFKDMDEFIVGIEIENREYLEYFFNQVRYAPAGIDIPYIVFSNTSLNLVPKEAEMIYFNEDNIYNELKKQFCNIDFISLELLYFKRGIIYLYKSEIDKFNNSICIDCGGFIGDTAIMFSQYNFSSIYSFEPEENNFNTMKKNIDNYADNKNIIPCNLGVGDKNETLYINSNGSIDAGATFLKTGRNESSTVNIVKLDDYFEDRKNRIGLIKLDIEGFEENALIGAEQIIRNDKPVLLVAGYHDWVAFGQMFRIKKWIENLNLGYKILFRPIGHQSILTWCFICYVE